MKFEKLYGRQPLFPVLL